MQKKKNPQVQVGQVERKVKKKLIPIRQSELEKHDIPFKPNTLYFWHSQGKYKEIFVKVAGKLFVDEDKFWEMVEGSR